MGGLSVDAMLCVSKPMFKMIYSSYIFAMILSCIIYSALNLYHPYLLITTPACACGTPLHHADVKVGETVVDFGSGAGIDAFLSANKVGGSGKVIGIDLTDEMLEKARRNAKENGYTNVEFRKGDIEKRIPVEDNSVDLVISNCVINLTTNKVDTFNEVYRILKQGQGRMVISDLVTDKEVHEDSVDSEKWCNCIDGALTKENYLESIRKAGFQNPEILEEKLYIQEGDGDRKISEHCGKSGKELKTKK